MNAGLWLLLVTGAINPFHRDPFRSRLSRPWLKTLRYELSQSGIVALQLQTAAMKRFGLSDLMSLPTRGRDNGALLEVAQ